MNISSNISAPFVRRPVATSLLTLAILMAGAVAFRFLPVAPLPQVDFPTISVNAGLPGASPETMASAVATPLERQFGRIAAVGASVAAQPMRAAPGQWHQLFWSASPSCSRGRGVGRLSRNSVSLDWNAAARPVALGPDAGAGGGNWPGVRESREPNGF